MPHEHAPSSCWTERLAFRQDRTGVDVALAADSKVQPSAVSVGTSAFRGSTSASGLSARTLTDPFAPAHSSYLFGDPSINRLTSDPY